MNGTDVGGLDELIGAPFRLGGRGPAYDCYGLVLACFRRRGIALPDPFTSDVRVMAAKDWILEKLDGWAWTTTPVPGAVAEFRPAPGVPAHVGYCLDATRVLHVSDDGAGVIVSRLDREPWASRWVGCYVYRG